jgi:hypothetical protein
MYNTFKKQQPFRKQLSQKKINHSLEIPPLTWKQGLRYFTGLLLKTKTLKFTSTVEKELEREMLKVIIIEAIFSVSYVITIQS